MVKEDGTELRQVFDTGQPQPNGQPNSLLGRALTSLTWASTGRSIHFVSNGNDWSVNGADVGVNLPLGGGEINLQPFPPAVEIDASLFGLLGRCFGGGGRICTFAGGSTGIVEVALPDVAPADLGGLAYYRWWPKSNQRKIAFQGIYRKDGISHREIFSVEYRPSDPTNNNVAQLTSSGLVSCSNTTNGVTTVTTLVQYEYRDPVPSPDARYVLVHRSINVPTYDEDGHCSFVRRGEGLFQLREDGALQATLVAGTAIDDAAWQPSPGNVAIEVSDGYGNGLDGLRVELRDVDHPYDVVDGTPRNVEGGTYLFEDALPGRYRVRVTLVEDEGDSFEILYTYPADEAVYAEREIDVPSDAIQSDFGFPIADTLAIIDSNVGASGDTASWHRLDDLANIYFQMHRFAKWIRANLTQDTGPKLPFYAFAESTPFGSHSAERSLYLGDGDTLGVYMGVSDSEYTSRDKPGDEAPENGEWHEFVHHLYKVHVSPGAPRGVSRFHLEHESRRLDQPEYLRLLDRGVRGIPSRACGGDSDYAGMADLQDHAKAWENIDLSELKSHEDIAVAALLWDLVDVDAESEYAFGSYLGSIAVPVTYVDAVSLPLADLWSVLKTVQPKTVFELERALRFLPQFEALTVDFNADGVFDANAVDPLFLMHGFFPVISNLSGAPSADVYRYDFASARFRGLPANDDVGLSSHRFFHSNGTLALEYDPRYEKPRSERSNIAIHARDASGTPLKGVAVEAHDRVSGVGDDPRAELADGRWRPRRPQAAALLRLLPAEGEPLPACNPVEDRQVNATVRGTINGYASADTPSFDNCLYWQAALGGGTGNAALSVMLKFPEDSCRQ